MVVINSNKGEFTKKVSSPVVSDNGGGTSCNGNVANNTAHSSKSSTNDCDSRGMLRLNQDLVINKGNLFDYYRMDKGAPCAT
jgi:hypothetical protein